MIQGQSTTELNADFIIEADHVLCVNPAGEQFSPGAIAVKGELITEINTPEKIHALTQSAANSISAVPVIKMPGTALMPGLINSHAHSAMTLLRGLADDLPLMRWLQDHIWPAESRWVSAEFVSCGTQLAIAEMLLSGTTCFTDMYFFPEITAQVAEQAGIRAQLACPIIDFPTPWAKGAQECLEKTHSLLEQFRDKPFQNKTHSQGHTGLIQIGLGPHAPYTVSDELLQKVAELADTYNTFIQMHVHETAKEIEDAIEQTGQRPLERLYHLGLLGPHFQAVHVTTASDSDIALLAQSGTHVIHCPASNLKLASGFAPIASFHQHGINVALGTDGAASNNDLNLFGEMKTASLVAKAVAQDASALPADQSINLVTANGAKALGRSGQLGVLTKGALADIIAVDLSHWNSQPLYHLISQFVYATQPHQVTDVWIAGKRVVQERQLITLDTAALRETINSWQEQMISQTA